VNTLEDVIASSNLFRIPRMSRITVDARGCFVPGILLCLPKLYTFVGQAKYSWYSLIFKYKRLCINTIADIRVEIFI